MNTTELRKAAKCVFLACPELVAKDLSEKLLWAADEIDNIKQPLNKAVEHGRAGWPKRCMKCAAQNIRCGVWCEEYPPAG